jgi:hypothetical protein
MPTNLGIGTALSARQAAFNPPAIISCVYSAACTVFDLLQMDSHPNSTNQAHNCLTSVIVETGVLPSWNNGVPNFYLGWSNFFHFCIFLVWLLSRFFRQVSVQPIWNKSVLRWGSSVMMMMMTLSEFLSQKITYFDSRYLPKSATWVR